MYRSQGLLGVAAWIVRDDLAGAFLGALALLGALAFVHLLGVALAVFVGVRIGARLGRGSGQELRWRIFGGVCGLLFALFVSFVFFQLWH